MGDNDVFLIELLEVLEIVFCDLSIKCLLSFYCCLVIYKVFFKNYLYWEKIVLFRYYYYFSCKDEI